MSPEERIQPTEEDGYLALRGHMVERAHMCRAKYGTELDWATFQTILADRDFVRFPCGIRFDDAPLMKGEFALPVPLGEQATDGFALVIRPCFQDDEQALLHLALYHVPSINYLDIATHTEAELFGATMLGLEVDEYYARVCAYADAMPAEFRVSEQEAADADSMRRHLEG